MNIQTAVEIIERLQKRLQASIVGRNEVIDLLIVALLSDGHVLLEEDYQGLERRPWRRLLESRSFQRHARRVYATCPVHTRFAALRCHWNDHF